MIRVFLDTNVFVSALLMPNNPPAKILELVLEGRLNLVLSPDIIGEIVRVCKYPRIQQALEKRSITSEEVGEAFLKIIQVATITPGDFVVQGVSPDPDDDMVLAGAVEGKADFIISGDRHLLELKDFQGIEIMLPTDFLEHLATMADKGP